MLVKADLQDWNSVSSFEVKTILLRHFACGKILSIVTNVKIVTNASKVVGTRLKKIHFFPHTSPSSSIIKALFLKRRLHAIPKVA